jgi:hypothetical protein
MQALRRDRVTLVAASCAIDPNGDLLNHQFRTLEQSPLAHKLIGEGKRFLYNAGKRTQLEVNGDYTSPSLPLKLLLGAFDDAQCNRKLMHTIPFTSN